MYIILNARYPLFLAQGTRYS